MPGPSPNPNARRQNAPTIAWVTLPAQHDLKAPKLPTWRKWDAATKRWWSDLWAKPQAVMWERDGSTLTTLACLYDDLITGRAEVSRVSAEMRQHEDRHGLSPRAMIQLRWRYAQADEEAIATNDGDKGASVVKLRAV